MQRPQDGAVSSIQSPKSNHLLQKGIFHFKNWDSDFKMQMELMLLSMKLEGYMIHK